MNYDCSLPLPQGQVLLNENGTRVANNPKILKYRDSDVTNNCGKSGKPIVLELPSRCYIQPFSLSYMFAKRNHHEH